MNTEVQKQKDRAAKALKLNGFDTITPSLHPISQPTGNKVRPTIHIKRLKRERDLPIQRLKGASAIQNRLKREKERARKALELN